MSEIRFPRGADKLLQYFEGVNREYPAAHWQNGAEMCRRWLSLTEASDLSQADVDAFVARLKAESNPGSGWMDLGMQFRHWARSRGLSG